MQRSVSTPPQPPCSRVIMWVANFCKDIVNNVQLFITANIKSFIIVNQSFAARKVKLSRGKFFHDHQKTDIIHPLKISISYWYWLVLSLPYVRGFTKKSLNPNRTFPCCIILVHQFNVGNWKSFFDDNFGNYREIWTGNFLSPVSLYIRLHVSPCVSLVPPWD